MIIDCNLMTNLSRKGKKNVYDVYEIDMVQSRASRFVVRSYSYHANPTVIIKGIG